MRGKIFQIIVLIISGLLVVKLFDLQIISLLLREISNYDYLLNGINFISFFTYWDLMVFPGWRAYMNA